MLEKGLCLLEMKYENTFFYNTCCAETSRNLNKYTVLHIGILYCKSRFYKDILEKYKTVNLITFCTFITKTYWSILINHDSTFLLLR